MSQRLLVFVAVAALGACDSFPDADNFPDRDGSGGSLLATTAEICAVMNACGLWFGQASCEENLLTAESCSQAIGYQGCMSDCVALDDCFSFDACESECWTAECNLGGSPAPF